VTDKPFDPLLIDAQTGVRLDRLSAVGSYGFFSWHRLADILSDAHEIRENEKILGYKVDETGVHFLVGRSP